MPSHAYETPDPSERLNQLKIELQEKNAKLGHIGKQRDELQTDITDLEQNLSEINSVLSDYGSKHRDLETALHGLQYFYDQKSKMALAAIGDNKDPIDRIIHDFDHETERMRDRVEELHARLEAARAESEAAASTQAGKQADYDRIKNYKKATEDRIAEMEGLRTAITQADKGNDIATMYFLAVEFKGVLDRTHIQSQHHLARELKEELGELEAAKEDARAKKAVWDDLAAEYAAQKATLEARRVGRREHLKTVIQTKFPPQAVPESPASAPTAA